jgi:GNAT superfamily N-acetyltransferase
LRRDYFDRPVCYFSDGLLRALARWIAKSNQVFLVTAEVDGKYAGFIFGHTLHPNLIWRQFARANPWYFHEIFWVWLRMHFFPWVNVHMLKKRRPGGPGNPENMDKLQELNIQTLDRPFAWSPNDPHIGYTELSFVAETYRGLGLSQHLSTRLCQEMSKNGVNLVESHIDSNNYSAVRATLKHGFEIFRMRGGDFYVRKVLGSKRPNELPEAREAFASRPFSFSLLSPSEIEKSPILRQEWARLLDSNDNLDLLYQSPQWFDHLMTTDNRLFLGVLRDNAGRHLGIVPIRLGTYNLKFDVYAHALWKISLRTAFVLGSQPLLPKDNDFYDYVFATIWNNLPQCECIYMDSVPTDCFLWQHLRKSGSKQENYTIYVPDGTRPYHCVLLPSTFDEYLSKFKRKKRYNLERQVNVLRDHGNGRLDVVRVDSEAQIESFLKSAVCVARSSWQQTRIGTRIDEGQGRHAKLSDVARRGLLRSYLLISGEKACAFVLGYQYRDVYHYVEIAYDENFAKFSPGTVLLYLLIKDLIQYNPPKRLNFGVGHASYKQEFGNIHYEDASVLLLRNNLVNKIRCMGHSSFRYLIRILRKRLRKDV